MIDDQIIQNAFQTLNNVKLNLNRFTELTGKRVALRFFEDKFGEYFVANKLIEHGFTIEAMNKKGTS